MKRMRIFSIAMLVSVFCASVPAYSQTTDLSRDALLRLVPDDAGVCLIVSDLKNTWQKITKSKWFTKLRETKLAKTLFEVPESRVLIKLRADLEKVLNVKWQQVRDDILGDQVVLAYFPPTSSRESERGLVLARVGDADLLGRLIERLNEKQKQFGELKRLEKLQHNGVEFVKRVERKGDHFYWIDGSIIVITSQESLMRSVIALSKKSSATASNIQRQLEKTKTGNATAAVFINPSMLEAEFAKQLAVAEGPEKPVLLSLRSYVSALQGVVVSLDLKDGIQFRLSLSADLEQLPEAGKRYFGKPTPISTVWRHFPPDTFFAVAGRIHAADAFRAFTDLLPSIEREQWIQNVTRTIDAAFDLDLQTELLPNIGPDWGFCVFAKENTQFVPDFLAAVTIRPGTRNVDQAIFRGLDRAVWSFVFQHNRTSKSRILMKSIRQDGAELMYLENESIFPKGVRPTIALKDGFLILASSPEAVTRFRKNSVADQSDEVPLARLSFRALHKWATQNQKTISTLLAAKNQAPFRVTDQIVGGLLESFTVFDRATIYQRTGGGVASWRLHIR